MIPKRPAPDLIRGGYRFSEKIMLRAEVRPNSLASMWAIKNRRKSAMPRAEQYRQHALEAEQQAKRACDRDAKEGLLEIARQWRELAEQGEPREPETTEA
jgi:hypothetical protein